jgi:2-oxoisovalerate dehydrogenase E1 component
VSGSSVSLADEVAIARDAFGKPLLPIEPAVLYRFGHLIRSTEHLLLDLFSKGLLSGTTHTCIGQECCQMAVVRALTHPDDAVLSNHRNHGHFLTYTGDVHGLIAEIMGRGTGVCGGVGGSQHLAYRHFHSNGVQAGMTAIGAGLALSAKRRGTGGIVACFIGDGTLGEGLTYESLNLASIWDVPMLFVVEHNGIAQTTPTRQTIGGSILERGKAFGLETWQLDDADPDLWSGAESAVAWVRATGRPGFLVIDTRRMGPHSKGDDLRDDGELEAIRARDPLARLGASLDQPTRDAIEASNRALVDAAREAAESEPDARYEAVCEHVFTAAPAPRRPDDERSSSGATPPMTVRASLNAALRSLLERDPRVLVMGEDLHEPYGGAFKVTAGLSSAFPGRVISTPISEAAIVGAAIGLALAGFRPIVEVMFADFLTLAMDQLYNHAVKFGAMFDGVQVPLVVRTPAGGRRGYGPTHSQNPENLMTAVPGLTVVFGSHRHDAGALLEAATLDWPYPVLFFEHKLLYSLPQSADDYVRLPPAGTDPAADRFPTLIRPRPAADLTVVAGGGMLPLVERAVAALEAEDFAVDIVAPSLLHPLPRRTLLDTLMGRARVAIVEESHLGPGFGSELAAALLEAGFAGRLRRVAPPAIPIPAARSLEAQVLVDEQQLFDRLARFLTSGDAD